MEVIKTLHESLGKYLKGDKETVEKLGAILFGVGMQLLLSCGITEEELKDLVDHHLPNPLLG